MAPSKAPDHPVLRALGIAVAAAIALAAAWLALWRAPDDAVEVWCAHDAVYAQEILDAFQRETGIRTVVRYDSEATKSLGLVERLAREGGASCDLFWNNEQLGTLALAAAGRLDPWPGAGWQRMPAAARDPDARWTGFGARLRVIAVHPPTQPADEAAVAARLRGDLARAAIAKPIYGTTLTQCAALWSVLGEAGFAAWYDGWIARGVRVVDGNGAARDLVAAGTVDLGLTDTDDACDAIAAGRPLQMLPLRLGTVADVPPELARRTIAIPNTVAVMAGCRHRDTARRLADYLLSERVELLLAASARQIPLGPVDDTRLPPEVRPLRTWAADALDLHGLLPARDACLAWLKARLAR